MWITAAGLMGATAVALGAFGAHALKARLDAASLATWSTAVEYHLVHALALLALALFSNATGRPIGLSAGAFTAGIVLFSGSLYLLALGGPRWLGPITPLGGACFIVGWIALLGLARSTPG